MTNKFFVFQVGDSLVTIDSKMTLGLTRDVKYASFYTSKRNATSWLSYVTHIYPEATIEEARVVLTKDLTPPVTLTTEEYLHLAERMSDDDINP